MISNPDKLRDVFSEALAIAAPGERARYLASACAQDPELRRQVDSLLSAHAQAGDFLRQPIMAQDGPPLGAGPGTVIGRYKLLQQIGEGGFGVVFMAEQQEPVRRMVALKIIKAGMDTREVVARFEAERQALALMDHPNIARVLDGGTTASGRPYFVMDLVKGIPITDYCEQNHLAIEARLRLFMKVCDGVQHAHQKGVIHRDLKPNNLLVTLHDGEPVPKVIDFGVAKAIGQKLTERTLFTRFEQLLGTPAYMSPEQAEWSGLDIDTRSDLYSLGVLLYELLTGTTPLEKETLARAALDEMRRMIRETEPPMPSTRLEAGLRDQNSDQGQRPAAPLATLNAQRSDNAALRRRRLAVRGDLDWIVMKALEKDRARRYETVNGLARDIERHLDNEPVVARPPSKAYRAGKFMRKHRVAVTAGAVVTLALLTGLVFALAGFAQARRASQQAQEHAAIAKAVSDFLTKDLLEQANPGSGGDRNVTIRELLDRAAGKINDRFTNQPLVEAAIRSTVGKAYRWLGEEKAWQAHLSRAVEIWMKQLGPNHPETLDAREELAIGLAGVPGRRDEAQRLLRELSDAYRATLGLRHEATINCLNDLAVVYMENNHWDEAEEILRELLEKQLHGPEHEQTRATMGYMAEVYAQSARYSEAVQLLEEVLQVECRKPGWNTPGLLMTLGHYYLVLGNYQRAVELGQEALDLVRRSYGPSSYAVLPSMSRLPNAYGAMGLWTNCVDLCREIPELTNNLQRRFIQESFDLRLKGAAAALLGGDTNAYRQVVGKMFALFRGTTNMDQVLPMVVVSLLTPDSMPTMAPVFELADSVPAGGPELLSSANIAKGMAAYRRGDFTNALQWFQDWGRCSRSRPEVSQAGYFCAMIHFQQGDKLAAQADMEEAAKGLAACLRSGQPGKGWYRDAMAVTARAEAERLILGREILPPMDAAWLDSARKRWEPVRRHIERADYLACQRRWSEARHEYGAAMRDPLFDWETADRAHSQGGSLLAARIGITFLLAKDSASHERLCEQLFTLFEERPDPLPFWHMLRTCLAGELDPGGDLIKKAGQWAAILAEHPGGVAPEGVSLIRTMAAYRSGRHQEAVDATHVGGKLSMRNAAQIVRAMALAKLGRREEGKTDLKEAETNLAKPLKNLTGDLWWDLGLCQLLLDEAHRVFGTPPTQ